MRIKPKYGIGKLRFGLNSSQVKQILGEPNETRKNEDEPNKYYLIYNNENLLLTFYIDEGDKLGYIETTNQNVNYNGMNIISKSVEEAKNIIFKTLIDKWEFEKYHSFCTLFNERIWLTLSIEFDKITGVELGVSFKDDESYIWPDEIDEGLKKDLDNSTKICDECGSLYFKSKSMMASMCPECSSLIYNYEKCEHLFEEGRCKYCYWDTSKSNYIKNKAST